MHVVYFLGSWPLVCVVVVSSTASTFFVRVVTFFCWQILPEFLHLELVACVCGCVGVLLKGLSCSKACRVVPASWSSTYGTFHWHPQCQSQYMFFGCLAQRHVWGYFGRTYFGVWLGLRDTKVSRKTGKVEAIQLSLPESWPSMECSCLEFCWTDLSLLFQIVCLFELLPLGAWP